MSNSKRKCKGCNRYLRQDKHDWRQLPGGWFHSDNCIMTFLRKDKDKKDKVKRNKTRKLKAEVKGIAYWMKQTQLVVNKYVRVRDKGLPCISCGKREHELSTQSLHGSVWDAGHFKSVGAHPELRFNTLNNNGQCRDCNGFKSGNIEGYTKGILARFGQKRLDYLNSPHSLNKYTIEYLARMRKVFNKKIKRIESRNSRL